MGKDKNVKIIEGCPDWMMTMGDCMSLLLCFFVLLMTFSKRDDSKLMDVLGGIKGALSPMQTGTPKSHMSMYKEDDTAEGGGVTFGEKENIKVGKSNISPVSLRSMKIVNKYNEFKDYLTEIGFKNFVTTNQLDEGISVTIDCEFLFKYDSTAIDRNALKILQSFANLASSKTVGNELRILMQFNPFREEGVYENDTWEFASDRIYKIGGLFHNKYHIAYSRISYGYEVDKSLKNDRVKLVLVEKIGTSELQNVKELINLYQGKED